MCEQLARPIEGHAVAISQAAGEQLDEAAINVGADDRPARGFDPRRVSVRVFVLGRAEVAFIDVVQRAGRFRLFLDLGMITEHDVKQTVGAQSDRVRAVLGGFGGEFQKRFDGVRLVIAVFVGQAIQTLPVRPAADGVHLAVERQQALGIGHFVGKNFRLVVLAVMLAVANKQDSDFFSRGKNLPEFIERHRQ